MEVKQATIFSKKYHIAREEKISAGEWEEYLRNFIEFVGRNLSCRQIVLGHIKILADWQLLKGTNSFFALSLTKLGQVDITPANNWPTALAAGGREMDLSVNIIVFGFSAAEVENVVFRAVQQSQIAGEKSLVS